MSEEKTRFARTAARLAELGDARADALAERVRRFVQVTGDERALDAGTGAGALARALAPLVREVVGLDVVPELLEQARARPGANVAYLEADATALPFESGAFDLAATLRTLHHVARPELVVAELVRVVRPGGHLLVADQIAPEDPQAAERLNGFERARDPSHARAFSDSELRELFEAHGLVLQRTELQQEAKELEAYLDLAGCEGEGRKRARERVPENYVSELAWYWLFRRG